MMAKDSLETIREKDYELIIFDCDGTLVDSEYLSNSVVAQMMRESGIDLSDDKAYQIFRGTSFTQITSYMEKELGRAIDFDFEPEFRNRVKIVFEEQLEPMPGITAFLHQLSISKCVASNGPKSKMETTLDVTGLKTHFPSDSIFSAYDIDKWKPQPDLFLHAAGKMGVQPEACLVFEDSAHGLTAAMEAGMDVILLEDRHQTTSNDVVNSVLQIKDFHEMAKSFF